MPMLRLAELGILGRSRGQDQLWLCRRRFYVADHHAIVFRTVRRWCDPRWEPSTPTLVGLGCPLLFHAGASLGVPITAHWRVLGTFEHLSNGKPFGVDCGTNQREGNQGLNNYGVSVGYAF